MFRVVINDIDYTSSIGSLQNVDTLINYNEANRIWNEVLPSSFTAYGALYTSLFKRILANQFNDILTAVVYKQSKMLFEGKVFISDCVFDLTKNSVTFSIVSKDWQSVIENNLDIPVPLDARFSKSSNNANQIPIPILYSANSGSYQLKKRDLTTVTKSNTKIFDINAVFKHIVNYVSDNTLQYYSAYLNTNYLNKGKLFLTNGYNLRNGSDTNCEVKFKFLFEDVSKLLNLVMFFSYGEDGVTKVLRIEDALTAYQSVIGLTLNDVQNISLKFDQKSYYSGVRCGGTLSFQNNTEINSNFWYPSIEGAQFGIEDFSINTKSNINNTLDLTINNFIIDHNKIEDCVANQNIDYDKDLFLLVCNGVTPYLSDNYNIASTTNNLGYYNEDLVTNKIIARHDIYGDIVKHHGLGDDTFLAYSGFGDVYSGFPSVLSAANPITNYYDIIPQTYPNDYQLVTYGLTGSSTPYDNNGNYDQSFNHSYECPSSGYYTFTTKDRVFITPILSNFYHVYKIITVTNSVSTITQQFVFKVRFNKYIYQGGSQYIINKESVNQTYNNASEPYNGLNSAKKDASGAFNITQLEFVPYSYYDLARIHFDININQGIYLDTGDKVTCNFVFVESDSNRINNSIGTPNFTNGYGGGFGLFSEYFSCNFSLNGGDVVINTRKGNGSLRRISFESFLTESQIDYIKNNSQNKISVNHEGNNFIGKIMSVNFNHKDNICKFDLKLD